MQKLTLRAIQMLNEWVFGKTFCLKIKNMISSFQVAITEKNELQLYQKNVV